MHTESEEGMKLGKTFPPGGRPPLRTVTEIAEVLGITKQQLMWALKREGAPQPVIRSREANHYTGLGRVWYEPRDVVRWYRATVLPDDPAAKRRQYHRDYYAKHYKKESKND